MDYLLSINLNSSFIISTASGAAGGLVSFLYALRGGHYRNNKYISKFLIELLGSAITAIYLTSLITESSIASIGTIGTAAFIVGTTWSVLIQGIRNKATSIVEAFLGQKKNGD